MASQAKADADLRTLEAESAESAVQRVREAKSDCEAIAKTRKRVSALAMATEHMVAMEKALADQQECLIFVAYLSHTSVSYVHRVTHR